MPDIDSGVLAFHPVEAVLEAVLGVENPLDAHTVSVWGVVLEKGGQSEARCWGFLSETEQQRATRYRSAQARERYILAHGCLRAVLGAYLHVAPSAVVLDQTVTGKPVLCVRTHGHTGLVFNLSHAKGRALLAVGRNCMLGVDLEQVRTSINAIGLAKRFFTASESAAIRHVPAEGRDALWTRYWVAKEAVLKAHGIGLHGLGQCEILFGVDSMSARATLEFMEATRTVAPWWIHFFLCEKGWIAALATQEEATVRYASVRVPRC